MQSSPDGLKSEIASLNERIRQGGDWHEFRAELAALHERARTEDEYVALLVMFMNLIAVAKFAFDEQTYAKILPIAAGEYRMFLNKEAMEDGVINPVLLDRVTRREVQAGRLDPNDDLRTLASASAAVLGDSAELTTHSCRNGDWLCYGMIAAALLAQAFSFIQLSPLWLIAIGLVVGWFLNERERKRIKESIRVRREPQ